MIELNYFEERNKFYAEKWVVMKITMEQFQTEIFEYVDHIKDLLSAKMWQNVLLDCSKNELFVLWLLFRQGEVNMTQIADYINTPLNTATGIISRMEKRQMVIRERSEQDKRIVTIRMGKKGSAQIQTMMYYAGKVVDTFSAEEMDLFVRMLHKLIDIMAEEHQKESVKPKIKKITIE
jgi:DNA-binding MarR family transcriptional regulator